MDLAAPPKTASRRTLVIVMVLVVLLIGGIATYLGLAGTKSDANAHATIATTEQPASGQGTAVSSHGVTITLPLGWKNLATTPAQLKAYLASAAKSDPNLAKMLSGLASNSSNSAAFQAFAILAVRATAAPPGNEILTVLVSPDAGETAALIVTQAATQLTAVGATGVRHNKEDLPGLDAASLHYNLGLTTVTGPAVLPFASYAVLDVNTGVLVSFSNAATPDDERAIVQSLKFASY